MEGGLAPKYVLYVFCLSQHITICQLCKLTLTPCPGHPATNSQSFQFSVKIFYLALAGGLNPISAALRVAASDEYPTLISEKLKLPSHLTKWAAQVTALLTCIQEIPSSILGWGS